jgi:hypothetical protein
VTAVDQISAGWYPDPSDARRLRWYDGTAWTEHVHDPAAAAPVAASAAAYAAPTYQTAGYAPTPYQPAGYAPAPYQTTQQASGYQLPSNGCQACGATPAIAVSLHEHHGMFLLQRFKTYNGQWCRDCGIAMFRHAQRQTLLLGWWGLISFFVNFVNVFQNVAVYSKLRNLGAPAGRQAAPLPAVGSVFVSPGFGVALALFAIVVFNIV